MIIDLILDRKDGPAYSAREFHAECMDYGSYGMGPGKEIASAMEVGTEEDVKAALCEYVDGWGYNPAIKEYINSVEWL